MGIILTIMGILMLCAFIQLIALVIKKGWQGFWQALKSLEEMSFAVEDWLRERLRKR